jgi:hypothetical protein
MSAQHTPGSSPWAVGKQSRRNAVWWHVCDAQDEAHARQLAREFNRDRITSEWHFRPYRPYRAEECEA